MNILLLCLGEREGHLRSLAAVSWTLADRHREARQPAQSEPCSMNPQKQEDISLSEIHSNLILRLMEMEMYENKKWKYFKG